MNTIGGTFVLNQESVYIKEAVNVYASFVITINLGTFTPLFTVPSDEYWDISRIVTSGQPARITIGGSITDFVYQNTGPFDLVAFAESNGNRILLPPGTQGWIDNRAGPATIFSIHGTKFRKA